MACIEAKYDCDMTVGAGAAGAMQYYLNGEPVFDISAPGDATSPVEIDNHVKTVRLKQGTNVIAIRIVTRLPAYRRSASRVAALAEMLHAGLLQKHGQVLRRKRDGLAPEPIQPFLLVRPQQPVDPRLCFLSQGGERRRIDRPAWPAARIDL